jgi:hypothetical protein
MRLLLLLPLLSLAAAPARADVEVKLQQLKNIGILPEEKLSQRPEEKIDPKKANPFAERAKAKEAKATETVETEEIKIRRVFDTLKISGITKYNGQYSALLGDLILEEGAQVAPVIQNQTQILRVTRITEKLVEIAWVEGAGFETVAPRKIVKRVELSPRVGVLLAAQPAGSTDAGAMTYLDENGKVIWPRRMTPDLENMMDTLNPSSTAGLTPEEEASLMSTPDSDAPPANVSSRESSPALRETPSMLTPEDAPLDGPKVDAASGEEDAVEAPGPEDGPEVPPAGAPSKD